jgi:hypothetical protein
MGDDCGAGRKMRSMLLARACRTRPPDVWCGYRCRHRRTRCPQTFLEIGGEIPSGGNAQLLWFQQYFFKERSLTLNMTHRAEEAGYSALCLMLDARVKPKRERNIRNNYAGPPRPTMLIWA